ncbi:rhomboid family intramembrane serine protease [Clostridium kluyveri]|uniref:rhomboid family intramembrane serine protease n=1 Tax=Clostridium kluyveri TaxID=1534 RepID=UPI00224739B7|nr:rhomboid family intramembrane serine protease [Clostridium kluyveri]UZQ49748.1 rhomboid family intramembrane serine protease [Clostridium kluyveri]
MNSYIDNLIEILYKVYNFKIIEIKKSQGLYSKWVLWREENDIIRVVFFPRVENINVEFIISDLKKLFQNKRLKFTQVIMDKEASLSAEYINNYQLDYEIHRQFELILINPDLNQLVYYTEGSKELANQMLQGIIHVRNSGNISSEKRIKEVVVTYVIIALNVLVYIVTSYLSGSIMDSNLNVLVFMGAKVNFLIAKGQYYRLFTCMFLHAGIVHLGVNMYSLYMMGTFIEKVYGKFKYIIIYIISGLFSSIFSYMFSSSISVGASGAIFGLLGASLVFALKMKHSVAREFIMNIMAIIVMNLIIGFSVANVDNFGHIGGLIGGIIITYVLSNMSFKKV